MRPEKRLLDLVQEDCPGGGDPGPQMVWGASPREGRNRSFWKVCFAGRGTHMEKETVAGTETHTPRKGVPRPLRNRPTVEEEAAGAPLSREGGLGSGGWGGRRCPEPDVPSPGWRGS